MALNITINKTAVAASYPAGSTVVTAVASGGTTPYTYSIATGGDYFSIDASTGVVTTKALMDAGSIQSFSVTATDSNSTPESITSGVVYPNMQAAIQNKFSKSNMIYKITKDIDLGNGILTIPANCTLDFQGGSFSNGILKAVSNKLDITGTSGIKSNLSIGTSLYLNSKEINPYNFLPKSLDNTSFNAIISPDNGNTKEMMIQDIRTAKALGASEIIPILMYEWWEGKFQIASVWAPGFTDIDDYINIFKTEGVNVKSLKIQQSVNRGDTSIQDVVTKQLMLDHNSMIEAHYEAFVAAGFDIQTVYVFNEPDIRAYNFPTQFNTNALMDEIVAIYDYFINKGVTTISNFSTAHLELIVHDFPIYLQKSKYFAIDYYPQLFIADSVYVSDEDIYKFVQKDIAKFQSMAAYYNKELVIAESGVSIPDNKTHLTISAELYKRVYSALLRVANESSIKFINMYTVYDVTRDTTGAIKNVMYNLINNR